MATRKSARKALATLFTTNGSFTAVYDYAPLDFRGASKVICIYADESELDVISKHMRNAFHTFFLDVYVKRGGGNSEDTLDDLREAVQTVVRANPTSSDWSHLEPSELSNAGFVQVAGIPYRMEQHKVKVKITN